MKRCCALLVLLTACATPVPPVAVEAVRVLKSGDMAAWPLEPGRYRLELTASHQGVRVEWPGSACMQGKGVKQVVTECELRQSGQLVVENASLLNLGLGQPVSVSVRVIRQR